MSRSTGTVGSLELLAGRARKGDRRAAAQLRKRMTPQVRELARALSADPRVVPVLARQALNDALSDDTRPYTWALVAAVQRRCAGRTAPSRKHERTAEGRLLAAVGVLCDVQGHTHDAAAALLGEPVKRIAALHAQGRSELGVEGTRTHCRGWHLVSHLDDLTPPEQEAGRRHLESCRPCEDALAARAAARLRLKAALPVGGTVLGGGVVALFAAVGGGSAGVGAAAVGAAAVLGTAGTVAVAVPPAPPPPAAPARVAPADVAPNEGAREQPAPAGEPMPDTTAPEAPTAPQVLPPDGSLLAPAPTAAPTATPSPGGPPSAPGLPTPGVPIPEVTLPPLPGSPASPLPGPGAIPSLLPDPLRVGLDADGQCVVLDAGSGLVLDVRVSVTLASPTDDGSPPTCDDQADVAGQDDAVVDDTVLDDTVLDDTVQDDAPPPGGQHAASDRETRSQDERLRDLREPRLPVSDVLGLLGP